MTIKIFPHVIHSFALCVSYFLTIVACRVRSCIRVSRSAILFHALDSWSLIVLSSISLERGLGTTWCDMGTRLISDGGLAAACCWVCFLETTRLDPRLVEDG